MLLFGILCWVHLKLCIFWDMLPLNLFRLSFPLLFCRPRILNDFLHNIHVTLTGYPWILPFSLYNHLKRSCHFGKSIESIFCVTLCKFLLSYFIWTHSHMDSFIYSLSYIYIFNSLVQYFLPLYFVLQFVIFQFHIFVLHSLILSWLCFVSLRILWHSTFHSLDICWGSSSPPLHL